MQWLHVVTHSYLVWMSPLIRLITYIINSCLHYNCIEQYCNTQLCTVSSITLLHKSNYKGTDIAFQYNLNNAHMLYNALKQSSFSYSVKWTVHIGRIHDAKTLPLHTTPASSQCLQLVLPQGAFLQRRTLVSLPLH